MISGFYNSNSHRAYPFVLGTCNRPADGPLTLRQLANDLIVDAGFVLTAKARFDTASDTVYLLALRREGSFFYFDFRSTAPQLFGVSITFSRRIDDPRWALEYSDSGTLGLSDSSLSGSSDSTHPECVEPLWYGFLVTGPMSQFELLLPGDGEIQGDETTCVIEPALLQNLSEGYVSKFAVANDDRTRVSAGDNCADVVYQYPADTVHISNPCMLGDVVLKPGFNAQIRQSAGDNSITLSAVVGAGAGEPCAEVPLFSGERPPTGSTLLGGGPSCAEVLRSINGVGGRLFDLLAGKGATITAVPDENTIIVDLNMSGLTTCDESASSQSCPS